jgi:hypothetical protein
MRKRQMNKTLLGMVSIVAISIPMTASGQTEDIFPPTDGQVMEPATPGTMRLTTKNICNDTMEEIEMNIYKKWNTAIPSSMCHL